MDCLETKIECQKIALQGITVAKVAIERLEYLKLVRDDGDSLDQDRPE